MGRHTYRSTWVYPAEMLRWLLGVLEALAIGHYPFPSMVPVRDLLRLELFTESSLGLGKAQKLLASWRTGVVLQLETMEDQEQT